MGMATCEAIAMEKRKRRRIEKQVRGRGEVAGGRGREKVGGRASSAKAAVGWVLRPEVGRLGGVRR